MYEKKLNEEKPILYLIKYQHIIENFSFFIKGTYCDENEYKLIDDLLKDYNKYARPSLNHKQTTDVIFGLSLSQLIDVVNI